MEDQAGYERYVVVHNIAKRHNVGTLARSATAFGVSELILVGRRDFNAFGSHGSTSLLRFRHFHSFSDARFFLKDRDCDICGAEITDSAVAVNQHPVKKSTAFLLGNEGTGLSAKECEICDFFGYVPQYGCGCASLNVTVVASIVLHHFGGGAILQKFLTRKKYQTEMVAILFGQDSLREPVTGTSLLWPKDLRNRRDETTVQRQQILLQRSED